MTCWCCGGAGIVAMRGKHVGISLITPCPECLGGKVNPPEASGVYAEMAERYCKVSLPAEDCGLPS